MNKQRETIYRKRRELLEPGSLKEQVQELVAQEISRIISYHAPGEFRDDWNYEEIYENLNTIFPAPAEARQSMKDAKTKDGLIDYLVSLANAAYGQKEKEISEQNMRQLEKAVFLRTIDMLWMDHLDEMEHLRDSVRLRAYGQKDPLVEYKNEGHQLFQRLLGAIRSNFVGMIYRVTLNAPMAQKAPATVYSQPSTVAKNPAVVGSRSAVVSKKAGRNDPCPCGSGKKFKKCCGR